ncbi:MAG: diacylglycerol kinase [Treponema sp.]|jgi:diacylglycerol kinase family enzyme|nr:diacylglycerol kinase [Treponema sp.]
MSVELFAPLVAEICVHSLVKPGFSLRWTVIANPKAGGFTIITRWKKLYQVLKEKAEQAKSANPRREDAEPSQKAGLLAAENENILARSGVITTQHPGHASKIVEDLIQEAGGAPANALFLVICAGGDGTSLEALTALYAAPGEIREKFAVLRLPMGTGNDGADAWELGDALDFLIHPTRVDFARALSLSTATEGKGPFLAFNILSVGLDAFVTHMTNKMKGNLPGDSYKLWVDLAALFYNRIYKVGPMEIKSFDRDGKEEQSLRETALLLAVGASGRRTYGSRKKILPDDRNVCIVREMPLWRKLALKDLFTTGGHVDKKETILFSAHRVEFWGWYPILAQMDGETALLQPVDFPAAIELTEPVIPVLKRLL